MRAFAICLPVLMVLGCDARHPVETPPTAANSSAPAQDFKAPGEFKMPTAAQYVAAGFKPEHARLLEIRDPNPSQQAQLMLWQSCKDRDYNHAGVDTATCEFTEAGPLPVQSKWTYDDVCSKCELKISWDQRYDGESQISTALMKVMYEQGFLQSIDVPDVISKALSGDESSMQVSTLVNKAVFYVHTKRLSETELLMSFSALPLER